MKAKDDEFHLLDPEVVESIPDLRAPGGPGEPIAAAARLAQKLEADRKAVLSKLRLTSGDGPMGPGTVVRHNSESDAQALLNGAAIETLTAPVAESERSSLMRQLRAVEMALPDAQQRVGEIESKIVVEQSERLRPIAQQLIADTVAAAEHLLVCLQAQNQFFTLLQRRGFHGGKRPAYLHNWGQEVGWLDGDNHRPPLEYYIRTRRESAGLEEERK